MVLQRKFEKTHHTWSIMWSCMMSEEWEFLSDFLGDQFTSWSTRFDYPLLSMEMLVLAIKLFSPFLKTLILTVWLCDFLWLRLPQARVCCVNKTLFLFETDLSLPVVNALSLLCLQQAGKEAGCSVVPLHSEKLSFKFTSFCATLIV